MSDSLKTRVREKLCATLRERGHPVEEVESDDPRLVAIDSDLAALDEVAEDDPLVEELATSTGFPDPAGPDGHAAYMTVLSTA
ncbi:hypothetical protein GS935_25610 [Rhodococcus hoagii]|nr:hypothetical protein [Prescottella equi]